MENPPVPPHSNPTRADIVSLALTFLGVDNGAGWNCENPFSSDLGLPDPEPWCADFVTDVFKRAGLPLPSMQSGHKTGFSSCPSGWDYAVDHKATYWSWQAQPGDIVIFGFGTQTPEHTGIVLGWNGAGNGTLSTIEGNSAGPDQPADKFTGVGGVHRHEYTPDKAPGGNANIIGIINTSKLVAFGGPAVAAALETTTASKGDFSAGAAAASGPAPAPAPAAQYASKVRSLALTSPAMEGSDVKAVQAALASHGNSPGTESGIFDVPTANAVLAFQAKVHLAATGIVDPGTRAALGL
jgi:hypothetical protein